MAADTGVPVTTAEDDLALTQLMDALYRQYSYDFRGYCLASQKRRVQYALLHMHCASISALQAQVLAAPSAFSQLLQYLTIPVTAMFRDPGFFLALRQHVLPLLHTFPSLKLWVAGCSTGEEVVSLAILLHEDNLLARTLIYATDINPVALERARTGHFALDTLPDYARNYACAGGTGMLSDYYTVAGDNALFDRSLYANVTFADHSLATDSVFSETHLVSCRNVLIYFTRPLQERVLGLFHDSLRHGGFLALGHQESLGFAGAADRFVPVVKRERIFRKR